MVFDRSDTGQPRSRGGWPVAGSGEVTNAPTTATNGVSLARLDRGQFDAVAEDLIAIYLDAMNYPSGTAVGRRPLWREHAGRAGFSCVVALDAHSRPVGFTYGYTGAAGQWWNTEVRRGLGDGVAGDWLSDYVELTELHVAPAAQGRGVGERVLRAFLADRAETHVLLSTPEGENRAWRLYRRLNFADLLRGHYFTGDPRPFGVLGRTLPLN